VRFLIWLGGCFFVVVVFPSGFRSLGVPSQDGTELCVGFGLGLGTGKGRGKGWLVGFSVAEYANYYDWFNSIDQLVSW
jgi:hypothetical protein